MDAALNRKRELYPDWDICYFALPMEHEEKETILMNALKQVACLELKDDPEGCARLLELLE